MTPSRLVLLVVAGCLTVLTLMLLVVPSAAMGPVILDVRGHGLHQGDVPVLGLWGIGMVASVFGWRL